MSQEILEFAPDADVAGYRLHELAVLNWGTFHGAPHVVRPDGRTAILTGANGAGKSTLADALLTLLVPNRKRNYNQAGQTQKRSERNERDYVLGAWSEKHDSLYGVGRKQFLRPDGDTYSVLLATFHNVDLNSWVSLAQILWVNTANRVEKLHFAESRRCAIEVEFADLERPSTIRRQFKERGLTPLESFTAYSERFHDLLCMPKDKTPMEIFNQAICIKDISDLTSFIREFMLDDGGAAEKLDNLRHNFTELRETNRRIEVAAQRLDALNLMRSDHDQLVSLSTEIEGLTQRLEILSPFFAEAEIRLRSEHGDTLLTRKAKLEADQLQREARDQTLEEKIRALDLDLERSDEGRRLKELEKELAERAKERDEKKDRRKNFDTTLAHWSAGAKVFDAASFEAQRNRITEQRPNLESRLRQIEDEEQPRLSVEKRDLVGQRNELEAEERSLLARTSNIPEHSLQARAFILEGLGLKPSDLPFIGELLQVRPEEAEWTGAIERLAHNFALCLLVRRDLRERVDEFVNIHRQRGLVVYHVVPETIASPNARLHESAVAHKLEVKSGLGDAGRWLATEITHRFDHHCCEDVGHTFRDAPSAITLKGLIKQKGAERRKDDRHAIDDASRYVLGWDNRRKLSQIKRRLKELEGQLRALDHQLETLDNERKELTRRIGAADKLGLFYESFAQIDWESVARAIDDLEAEKSRLEKGSDRLRELKTERQAARVERDALKVAIHKGIEDLALAKRDIEENVAKITRAEEVVAACETAAEQNPAFANFRERYPAITASLAFPLSSLDRLSNAREEAEGVILRERRQLQKDYDSRSHRIKRDMERFVAAPENAECKDALIGEFAVAGYDPALFLPFETLRQHIKEEDLPKNRHRFETLLHSTITDDVFAFDALLRTHADRIEGKIAELNGQLRQIEFDRREHTYIQLIPTRAEENAVREFKQYRRNALHDALHATTDRDALKERYHRIETLLNYFDEDPERTRRVIDVRNWFTFRADEHYRADESLRQSYSGASGKSGGEKNRLASTILATAIAYQYGISVHNRQTETFRLVAVDEMFSKTDDEFSNYLLDLFKEFHLQLLIIQPLDAKLHLVQKYVERYHIVTKRSTRSAVHTLSVHEYTQLREAVAAEAP
jgi:uncharacterized protein YPO0396